jgi:hypothetical protein
MEKYHTKFTNLTLAVDKEPEEFLEVCLKKKWTVTRIFNELRKIAQHHKLPMVDRRTVHTWVTKQHNHKM